MIGKEELCKNCVYAIYNPKERKWICRFHWVTIKDPDGEFVHACVDHKPLAKDLL